MASFIRSYGHWEVSLHENQGYLGRCVIWCKRLDALDLTDATLEERDELFLILEHLKKALTVLYRPDWFNYAFLGNGVRHLHCHLVPRYASERELAGYTFSDERYGHNYRTNHDFVTPDSIYEQIREAISVTLDNLDTREDALPWRSDDGTVIAGILDLRKPDVSTSQTVTMQVSLERHGQ